jgi:hypothetical protein
VRRRHQFLAATALGHVLLACWVRRDARRRETDPSPWDLLTALTGGFGLLGYLRARR